MNNHLFVSISDEELSQWASTRADDAGRLARELIQSRQEAFRLVVAAREFWDIHNDLRDESMALDKALETFASKIPYSNEPEAQTGERRRQRWCRIYG